MAVDAYMVFYPYNGSASASIASESQVDLGSRRASSWMPFKEQVGKVFEVEGLQLRHRADAEHRQPVPRHRRRQGDVQPLHDHPQDRPVVARVLPDGVLRHAVRTGRRWASARPAAVTSSGSFFLRFDFSWSRSRRSPGAMTRSRRTRRSSSSSAACRSTTARRTTTAALTKGAGGGWNQLLNVAEKPDAGKLRRSRPRPARADVSAVANSSPGRPGRGARGAEGGGPQRAARRAAAHLPVPDVLRHRRVGPRAAAAHGGGRARPARAADGGDLPHADPLRGGARRGVRGHAHPHGAGTAGAVAGAAARRPTARSPPAPRRGGGAARRGVRAARGRCRHRWTDGRSSGSPTPTRGSGPCSRRWWTAPTTGCR